MSLVIAIRDKDRFILGSDKQTSFGGNKSHDNTKIWELPECPNVLMGSVGMLRAAQIIQSSQILDLNELVKTGPSTSFIIHNVVPRIVNLLEENGFRVDATRNPNMDASTIPNSFIIACDDMAWTISSDLSVTEIDDYAAIGSGEAVAWGCLYATKNGKNSFDRIKTAIDAAAETTLYVDHEIDFLSTRPRSSDIPLIKKALGIIDPPISTPVKKKTTTKKSSGNKKTKKDNK